MQHLFLVIALTLQSGLVLAQEGCECLWQGSFVDVQSEADVVVSATVVASKGNSIDLALQQTLRGETHRERIRVWLQTGKLCWPPATDFPLDSQWVMALDKIDSIAPGGFNPSTPSVSYGRIGDYALSSCGGFWLSQTGQFVSGNLINAPRWERNPKMSPVLLSLVAAFIDGDLDRADLSEASRDDPALRELMLDTRAFLREGN